jgi:hypothetical protein
MATITGSNVINTAFSPSVGEFTVEVSGGQIQLLYRSEPTTGTWVLADILQPGVHVGEQVVTAAEWKFTPVPAGSATGITFLAAQN